MKDSNPRRPRYRPATLFFLTSSADGCHGRGILLPRADAVDFLDRQHEDLAVPHVTGAGGPHNRPHRRFDKVVGHPDLESDLFGEFDLDRCPPVGFHALELASMALHPGR